MIARLVVTLGAALASSCAPARYRPSPIDFSFRPPVGVETVEPPGRPSTESGSQEPAFVVPGGPLSLDTVIGSVTSRYPPYLSVLLERDLASGRLQQAMGGGPRVVLNAATSGRLGLEDGGRAAVEAGDVLANDEVSLDEGVPDEAFVLMAASVGDRAIDCHTGISLKKV